MSKIFKENEWSEESLMEMWKVIDKIATEKYGLDHFPIRFEIVNYSQMLSAYSSHGMPNLYNHWSFGKSFIQNESEYEEGRMALAYELIVNTSPNIAYLMENNTAAMQTLVMAHAAVGHANFFKHNFLFQLHTKPDHILGFLEQSKNFINECEKKYGANRVEKLLDAAHSLMDYGVNRCIKKKSSAKKKKEQKKDRVESENYMFDSLFESINISNESRYQNRGDVKYNPKRSLNEDNILVFLSQHSLTLQGWEKEILSIVAYLAQYFYPQMQTKMMNEGWASFWHYQLLNDLYDEGYIDEAMLFETLASHTNVCCSHSRHSWYPNPYRLGFHLFQDIKKKAGDNWLEEIKFAAYNFKDESFVLQYLTDDVIRQLDMMCMTDSEDNKDFYELTEISDDAGYDRLRKSLANSYNLSHDRPDIFIRKVFKKDRKLIVSHRQWSGHDLNPRPSAKALLHLRDLWGGEVDFEVIDENGIISLKERVCDD